jgi:DNA-binding response OmpR family regulator
VDSPIALYAQQRRWPLAGIRTLLVHPDDGWCRALTGALTQRGLDVVAASSPEQALELLEHAPAGALVVEVQLGAAGARRLIHRVEASQPTLPVFYLLGERRVEYVIQAIRDGSVDVIVQSDNAEQTAQDILASLLAHVRRIHEHWLLQHILAMADLLADTEPPAAATGDVRHIAFNHVQLDLDEQTIVLADSERPVRSVRLTQAECNLLAALMSQAGRVMSVEELARDALGYLHTGRDPANAVRHHLMRIRNKIGADPEQPALIHTVRGRGYVFDPQWLGP